MILADLFGRACLPPLPACQVRFLHAMRLNSQAGTEGSPVSSLNCDRPSHPDRGRLVCGESRRCG